MNTFVRVKTIVSALVTLIVVVVASLPSPARAQSFNTYAVVIDHVTTGMGDSCGGPEFYAAFHAPWLTSWRKSSEIGGRDFYPPRIRSRGDLTPTHGSPDDWGIWGYVNEGETDRIVIRLVEPDDAFCGGGDDHVDITRDSGKDLYLWVSRTPGEYWVYFEDAWHECPRYANTYFPYHSCRFITRGTGDGSATVELSIHFPGGW